jgi:hypothetical protein
MYRILFNIKCDPKGFSVALLQRLRTVSSITPVLNARPDFSEMPSFATENNANFVFYLH